MLKLKQDSWFYSHPGHCSLGGDLQVPHPVSPQVFTCYMLLINHIPFLLQMSHYGKVCLLSSKGRSVEKRYGSPVGEPQYLPSTVLAPTSLPLSGRNVLLEWP